MFTLSDIESLPDAPVISEEQPNTSTEATESTPETTEVSTDTATGSVESTEAPQEQAATYSILPDSYKIPETFENEQAELNFYRAKYGELQSELSSEQFMDKIWDAYGQQIMQREEQLREMSDHIRAMQNNPREYIKQYFPEKLAEAGISPVLTNEEINTKVEEQLAAEFGPDWKNLYSAGDLVSPLSYSSQVLKRSMDIQKEWQDRNTQSEKFFNEYTQKLANNQEPVKEIDEKKILDEAYTQLSTEYKIDQKGFDEFVDRMKNFNPTYSDWYKLANMNKFIEDARKAGIEEGKKAMASQIGKVGKNVIAGTQESESKPDNTPNELTQQIKAMRAGNFNPLTMI